MRTIMIAAALFTLTVPASAAEPAAKTAAAAANVPTVKARAARKSSHQTKTPKVPALERFSCRTGPNDEQVRLIVEAVKGRAMEFAFYSRLETRVCSIHSRRGDGLTRWEDAPGTTGKSLVKLLNGNALVEYEPGHVKITFSDVERMGYCGMYGDLNGTIDAVMKKPECGMQGLFDDANNPELKVKPAAPG